jgi:hypothetical protein
MSRLEGLFDLVYLIVGDAEALHQHLIWDGSTTNLPKNTLTSLAAQPFLFCMCSGHVMMVHKFIFQLFPSLGTKHSLLTIARSNFRQNA